VTAVTYVIVAMSIDNNGEGGILALMSLLGVNKNRRSSPQLNRAAARDVDLYQSNRRGYGSFCER